MKEERAWYFHAPSFWCWAREIHRKTRLISGSPNVTRRRKAGYFDQGLLRFLAELATNNNREWFQTNKDRYESEVKEPMLGFIADFATRLRTISANFDADPRPYGWFDVPDIPGYTLF